jgi:hypothetical protein
MCILGFILRINTSQKITRALICQVGGTEIPALVSHVEMLEVTETGGDLKAYPFDL